MTEPTTRLPAWLDERFTIGRELGRGGMATVYLAEERKHGRQVAIKVMRADLAASVGGERFLRDIGIVARLSHPHIVPLIDSGDADGVLYYVSPYVPGGSLRDRITRDGRLPIAEATRRLHARFNHLWYRQRPQIASSPSRGSSWGFCGLLHERCNP